MKNKIDIDNWVRKEHYKFFKTYDEPFWGITTNVDCTNAYRKSKELNIPFFIYYLYLSLKSVNQIEEFKYRIEGEDVYCYDVIHAAATVLRENGTFGFSFIKYNDNLPPFTENAKQEIERVKNDNRLMPAYSGENVIHYTTVPWISFSGVSHPRRFSLKDSVPKIAFGKIIEENSRKLLPIAIHAHHALVDGLHVGKYLELFQKLLDE
ncbi:MAG: chloramphenicol acetyltransferase [Bacteroidota bacterium]|nr:chloramphenicol acetyltransferase [Bacteroidota bacterium]